MTVTGDSSDLPGSPVMPAERRDLAPLWRQCVITLTYVVGVFGTPEPLHDSFPACHAGVFMSLIAGAG